MSQNTWSTDCSLVDKFSSAFGFLRPYFLQTPIVTIFITWFSPMIDPFRFPQETKAERKRMMAALTWEKRKKLSTDDIELLDVVAELDEENRQCPEFKKVAKLARETLLQKEVEKTLKKKKILAQRKKKTAQKAEEATAPEPAAPKPAAPEAAAPEPAAPEHAAPEQAKQSVPEPAPPAPTVQPSEPLGPRPSAARAPSASAPSSSSKPICRENVKGPEQLKAFLPGIISHVYVNWQPKQRRISVQFARGRFVVVNIIVLLFC